MFNIKITFNIILILYLYSFYFDSYNNVFKFHLKILTQHAMAQNARGVKIIVVFEKLTEIPTSDL